MFLVSTTLKENCLLATYMRNFDSEITRIANKLDFDKRIISRVRIFQTKNILSF